jgi:hypothetical protein
MGERRTGLETTGDAMGDITTGVETGVAIGERRTGFETTGLATGERRRGVMGEMTGVMTGETRTAGLAATGTTGVMTAGLAETGASVAVRDTSTGPLGVETVRIGVTIDDPTVLIGRGEVRTEGTPITGDESDTAPVIETGDTGEFRSTTGETIGDAIFSS